MKRGATKEEIIRATQRLIARNGIRAVRVDEIAQTLGISKRTLYELFADKDDLVVACLDAMRQQQRQRLRAFRRRSGCVLTKTFYLLNEYIDGLYVVERSFLSEIRQKGVFVEQFVEHSSFWHNEMTAMLELCRTEGLLFPELDSVVYAKRLIATLLELRSSGISREELHLFGRVFLRGVATRLGIETIYRIR